MKLGAEPKKVVVLVGLLAVAGAILYFNVFADSAGSAPAPVRVAPSQPAPVVVASAPRTDRKRERTSKGRGISEFKPYEGTRPGEDKPDPATIDPTLRLDLLAKVQNVEPPASMRNIFQYGTAPPPPAAAKPVDLPKAPPKIAVNNTPPPPPGPPPTPPAPTAPPMTFKYYGYKASKADGHKQASLLDGEDIIIAGENDTIKRGRYKIVRIGVTSIVIEDTQFKSTQTLPLAEDAPV